MAEEDPTLRALPYHEALVNYLQTEEPETWAWFDSAQAQTDFAESLRLELLKQTYRLEAGAHPALYEAVIQARTALGLDVPVTVYQSQRNRELNAALYFLPGEAHIVLDGDVQRLLDAAELRAVLGHELAHYLLWSAGGRRFFVADRMVEAMAAEPNAEPSHVESARLLRLYTEIFADRGSLLVTRDPVSVVTSLVKMQTGVAQVDAASYVRQADEVFARSKVRTEELSHPETFIRARAITLQAEGAPGLDAEVVRMIEGAPTLDKLDLLGQRRMSRLTRQWLQLHLEPEWFRTDAVLGHARLFFPDFEPGKPDATKEALVEELRDAPPSIRDYFCYLLLDFAAIDPELEDEPLRAAFRLAAELDWSGRLETLVVKELKLKKREAQAFRAAAEPDAAPGAATKGSHE